MTIKVYRILCDVMQNTIWIKRDEDTGEISEIDCPYYQPDELRERCATMGSACMHEYRRFQNVPDKLPSTRIDSEKIIYLKDRLPKKY